MAQPAGLISRESPHGVEETVRRFRAGAEAAGLTIFAEIDHDLGAAAAGLDLRPTRLILFGNARSGTPLMQAAQTTGIDLPLKVLVWEDAAGRTHIGHNDPLWVAERHGVEALPEVSAMLQGLAHLEREAIG